MQGSAAAGVKHSRRRFVVRKVLKNKTRYTIKMR